jgi:hypothetical protein
MPTPCASNAAPKSDIESQKTDAKKAEVIYCNINNNGVEKKFVRAGYAAYLAYKRGCVKANT